MTKEVLHCYLRVSTRVQETEGTSLDTQKEQGVLRAKELGFKHKIWNEGAKSSHHEDIGSRPVLSSLLTEIRDGAVKHLWVIENSRLSRNDMVASTIRYECNKAGVILYTKDGRYDLNNPSDTFTRQILDATSQLENALRTERSRLGKLQKARNGFWHGGPPPFGYELKNKKLVSHPDESKWLKRIFNEYSKGTSTMDIKTMLDTNGVTPRRGGRYFSIGSIQAILRNTHYDGRYVYTDSKTDESVEVSCPRLVDKSVYRDAQKKREGQLRRKGQVNRSTHFYMLRDIMVCGHCGTNMGGRTNEGRKQHYYYCPAKERIMSGNKISFNGSNAQLALTNQARKWERGRHCSMVRSLNISTTDEMVWNAVKETVSNSHILKERMKTELLAEKGKTDEEYKRESREQVRQERAAKRGLKRVEESTAKIETDRLLEKMDEQLYKRVRANLDAERANAMSDLEQLRLLGQEIQNKKRWIDWVGKFKETYENVDGLPPEERKAYLLGVLREIKVNLDTDTNEHVLEIEFQFPIVDDQYRKGDSGWEVIDGDTKQVVKASFSSKYRNTVVGNAKKKHARTTN